MFDKDYQYDKFIEFDTVECGSTALARSGLIMFNLMHLNIMTSRCTLDHLNAGFATLHYNSSIDFDYEVTAEPENPRLRRPSKERALVECILHLDWIDEGLLIEGLKSYLDYFWNEEKLREVADHFGLAQETLDYWLQEAREDCEV